MPRRSRWIWLALLLALVNGAIFVLLPRFRYRSIVIHHTASQVDNYESIRQQHLRKGWTDAAYHLILSNGSTEIPAGHLEATGRYARASFAVATASRWCNASAVHLCIVGDYEDQELPAALQRALAHAIVSLQRRYGVSERAIRLHRDCNETLCPGRFVDSQSIVRWLPLALEADARVREQHRAVLGATAMVPWRLSAPLARTMGLASVAVVLIGLRWPVRGRPRGRRRSRRNAGSTWSDRGSR